MRGLQHQMPAPVDFSAAFLRRLAPGEEHDSAGPFGVDDVDDLLRQALPAFVAVAVGVVSADGEAGVEEEDAAVGPGGEQAAVLGWWAEVWVVLLERGVHVLERWWSWGRRPDREAQSMRLVVVVVGVLAQNDGLHFIEWRVARPAVDVCRGREDLLARFNFRLEEALEIEEFLGHDFILQRSKPALAHGVDFEGEKPLLLGGEFGDPCFLVEFRGLCVGCGSR